MQNRAVLREHAALVDRMSDRLDVDLEEEVLRGNVSPDVIPDLVLRCTNCANPGACKALLETGQKLAEAPSYCMNADTFAGLR